jgi:hypothetical protein
VSLVASLLAAALVVVIAVATWCVSRARRLDRLHVRTDSARTALDAALARRAETAQRVARALGDAAEGLGPAAAGARDTRGADRERAENELGRRLAAVPRATLPGALLGDLVDAERLVVLARRVHNDAVRDTLALRSRRLVRWFRLAGHAPVPAYFEIADPQPSAVSRAAPSAGAQPRGGPAG